MKNAEENIEKFTNAGTNEKVWYEFFDPDLWISLFKLTTFPILIWGNEDAEIASYLQLNYP